MRILIDMQGAQSASRFRGIGRYSSSLVEAMVDLDHQHELIIVLNGNLADSAEAIRADFCDILPQEQILVWQGISGCAEFYAQSSSAREVSAHLYQHFLQSLQADRILVTSFFEGFVDDAVTANPECLPMPPMAVIAYDLIPMLMADVYLTETKYKAFYERKLAEFSRFDHFLCISESTRSELRDFLEISQSKTTAILGGVSESFAQPVMSKNVRQNRVTERPYILYPGGFDERKNLPTLINAFATLRDPKTREHQLVIIGDMPANVRSDLLELIKKVGLPEDKVVLPGYIPESEIAGVYANASLTVFPSRHEGFGLPILESIASGTPIIAADAPGSREVLANPSGMFNPDNVDELSNLIERALADEDFRESLMQNGKKRIAVYSWENVAKRAIAALEQMPPKPIRPSGDARPKLAYISPLPPAKTGIADYSSELLPSLSRYYEVDCVVAESPEHALRPAQLIDVIDLEDFRRRASEYERIIYHCGNSPFHSHMYELLEAFPGVVVMHDQFYGSFLMHEEQETEHKQRFWHELYDSHGWHGVRTRALFSNQSAIEEWPAHGRIVQTAIGVISHSNFALEISKQMYGEAISKKWSVVSFPRKKRTSACNQEEGDSENPGFQVSTFGFVDEVKCARELVEAWAQSSLCRSGDNKLVFVGQNHGGEFGDQLEALIETLDVQDSVTITGYLDEASYRAEITKTDLAIQLRKVTRGETSAAIFDCLVAGIPTIVNQIGAFRELPSDVVKHIPHPPNKAIIAKSLAELWIDEEGRKNLGTSAALYAARSHSPDLVAKQVFSAVEEFYLGRGDFAAKCLPDAAKQFSRQLKSDPDLLNRLADAAWRNAECVSRQRSIFLDVSALVNAERITGIERTAKALLNELIANPPEGFRCEPCYATKDASHLTASTFLSAEWGVPEGVFFDEPIEPLPGDILFVLDWQPEIARAREADFEAMRKSGVKLGFLVYDMLPSLNSEWFPDYVSAAHADWLDLIKDADFTISISRTVAKQLDAAFQTLGSENGSSPHSGWFHLGADLPVQSHSKLSEWNNLKHLEKTNFVLMVGTIEPRKGHAQVIDAMEILSRSNKDMMLVVVGNQGWMVDDLVDRLNEHENIQNDVTWIKDASDELLQVLYREASGLIMASEGEGFGLPIVEAAHFDKPLLVRDIPVFRELCGTNAQYFKVMTGEKLAPILKRWFSQILDGTAKSSGKIQTLDWHQSVAVVAGMLKDADHPNWMK